MKRRIFALSMVLLSALMFCGCLDIVTTEGSSIVSDTPSDVAEEVIDSVVTIFVVDSQTNAEITMGSGVCIRDGGYIVTNYHVIYKAEQSNYYSLVVYLNDEDVGYSAQLLWSNSNLDVAIIHCSNTNIPYVNAVDRVFSSENRLQLLEPVISIGTPLNFAYQNSCTFGYVSGLDRYSLSASSAGLSQNVYENLIQHTASISTGNSGGGLFDMQGNLIGLNTLGSNTGNDMYFAVPIYPVLIVLDKVIACENADTQYELPLLGISVVDEIMCEIFGEDIISQEGLYVSQVSGNAEGILQVGDIVVKLSSNDKNFDITCRNDLIYALMQMNSNDTISLEIIRDNAKVNVNVTLS